MESSGKPLRQVLPNQREVQTTRSPVDSGVKCSPRGALVLKRVAVARQRDHTTRGIPRAHAQPLEIAHPGRGLSGNSRQRKGRSE